MRLLQSFIALLGRWALSGLFIALGIHMLLDWRGVEQQFIRTLCDWLTLTLDQESLHYFIASAINWSFSWMVVGLFCALVGGLLVFFGIHVRLGATLLLLLFIPATVLFHPFWTTQGPKRSIERYAFAKNTSVAGGLLLLLAYGKGKRRAKEETVEVE